MPTTRTSAAGWSPAATATRSRSTGRRTPRPASFRFVIDPVEQLRIYNEIEDAGLDLGAIYHSHTRSEPYPSQTDINFAKDWPGVLWIIIGLANGEPEVRTYEIRDGQVADAELEITDHDRAGATSRRSSARDARRGSRRGAALLPGLQAAPRPAGHRRGARLSSQTATGALRKVKPQLSEGELVKVAWARNESEGEFIQGLLLEEGVPSMLRRSAGFDVPDFLAAGPRDVMVPISGAQTAREVLLQADVVKPEAAGRPVDPRRLLARPARGAGRRRAARLAARRWRFTERWPAATDASATPPRCGPACGRRTPATAPPAAPAGAAGRRSARRPARPPRGPAGR